jgi:predicted permease
MNDLKFALRQLLKNPGFTTVAVISLALGIGAGTAIFSLVNAILLRSLPVPNPHELRVLQWTGTDARMRSISGYFNVEGNRSTAECVSPTVFLNLREKGAEIADIFAFAPLDDVIARARHEAFAANGMVVSDNFFSALGLRPFIGRLFAPGANDPNAAQQAVITFDWWEKHFGQDPEVVGQTVTLNGSALAIVGVLPRGFSGVHPGNPRGFYVLLTPESQFLERPVSSSDHWWVRLMARLRPGGSDHRLKAALDVVFSREAAEQMKNPGILVQPGQGGLAFDRNTYGKPLLLMLGAVGLVMLVACANLAGLSLARGAARHHELALRAALGAGRWRLIRQSLAETMLLGVLGGGLGVLVAIWGRTAISRLLAGSLDGLQYDFSLDVTVLSFTVAAALLTALLSGLLPALRAGRADPLAGLKARAALGVPRLQAGRVLVVAQIALSVLLLSAAGLYLRTLDNLKQIDAGFDTERLLVFQVNPGFAGYKDAQLAAFYDQVQTSLTALPGVRGATPTVFPLLDNKSSSGGFSFSDRAGSASDNLSTYRLVVGETFFSTMGIPMLRGRGLSAADADGASKVIVINETFARKYFHNEDPLGRSINTWRADWRIVGVCRDAKYQNIKEPVPPTAYISFRQFPLRYGTFYAVRTALPPLTLATAVRKAVAGIDPAVPVARVTTQDQLLDASLSKERLFAALCGALALFALLLSCIGLYGLMAFNVARRRNEIGIRMAIGARPVDVARAIVHEALILAAVGIGAGLPAAFAVARLIQGHLYGVPPNDPATLGVVIAALVAVALLAAWLPARRASKVDPIEALRSE